MIKIILNDSKMSYDEALDYFVAADTWAKSNCASYSAYETIDVSDVSLEHDILAEYVFESEKDAAMFILRWK